MPIGVTLLNDGRSIPNIAYGTGSYWKGKDATDGVSSALFTGFRHIDTAQAYGNEEYVGHALDEWLSEEKSRTDSEYYRSRDRIEVSGHERKHLWVTTKYGGVHHGPQGPLEALKRSLEKLRLDYVDLYLIHNSQALYGSLEDTWREFERARELGLAKSIGVSNFDASHLKELLKVAKVKPAVNQIQLHAYVYQDRLETLQFCKQHKIVVEAYNSLYPITQRPNGSVAGALAAPAARLGATPGQVLFQWVRAKGAVVVTTSSKEERMREYLGIGDLGDLTEEEVQAIDSAAVSSKTLPDSSKSQEISTQMHNFASESKLEQGQPQIPQQPRKRRSIWMTLFIFCHLVYNLGLFTRYALPYFLSRWPFLEKPIYAAMLGVLGAFVVVAIRY